MAIVDHFEHTEEPGFMATIDPEEARQQFAMSFGLVVVLAISVATIALTCGAEPQILARHMRAAVRLVVQMPQRVQVQQAAKQATELPGG